MHCCDKITIAIYIALDGRHAVRCSAIHGHLYDVYLLDSADPAESAVVVLNMSGHIDPVRRISDMSELVPTVVKLYTSPSHGLFS